MEDSSLNPEILTPTQSPSQSTPLTRDIVKKHYEHQFELVKQAFQLCRDKWESLEAYGKPEKFMDILQEIILNAKIDRKEDGRTIHFFSRELPTQVYVWCDQRNIHAILHYPGDFIKVWINLGKDNDLYVDVEYL